MATISEVIEIFHQVKAQVIEMFGESSANGWKFTFNNRAKSLGVCSYQKLEIQFSKKFLHLPHETIRNTISHEFAHAIAGHAAGHGREWKRVHKMLGGTSERVANITNEDMPKAKYKLVNTLTDEVVKLYYKRPSRNVSRLFLRGKPETRGKLVLMTI